MVTVNNHLALIDGGSEGNADIEKEPQAKFDGWLRCRWIFYACDSFLWFTKGNIHIIIEIEKFKLWLLLHITRTGKYNYHLIL